MKHLYLLGLICLGIFGCNNPSPTDSFTDQPLTTRKIPKLLLVKMDGGLARGVAGAINFGEIISTRTLRYIIMNTGDVDIFDLQISANQLDVYPKIISSIPADIDLEVLPILEITQEHVVPVSGVGFPLPFDIGQKLDTLSLSYRYEATFDSVLVSGDTIWTIGDTLLLTDLYPTAATKMGAILDLIIDGIDIHSLDLHVSEYSFNNYGAPLNPNIQFARFILGIPSQAETFLLRNSGNVSIPILLFRGFDSGNTLALLDTVLANGDSLNFSQLVTSLEPEPENPNIGVIFGFAVGPTEYMFKSPESREIIQDGLDHFLVQISPF